MDWEVVSLFLIVARLIGATALTWAAWATGLFSAAFSLTSLLAGWYFLRPKGGRGAGKADSLPPITIMKPLKGVDRGLYENLASFCVQDYPTFQIVFCLADEEDPARSVLDRLRRDFPRVDLEIVVSQRRMGRNPKISNLANAYPRAKYETLLISDSDIRVAPNFLRRMVGPLEDPRVGLVTCFYRIAGARGLWGLLEAFSINLQFLPQALTASVFGMSFAMGAANLVRRSAFEKGGGFENLADHIADDYRLGLAIREAGYRIEFSRVVVDSFTSIRSAAELVRHQVRESRTIRICQPYGYCGTLLLQGFSLLSLKVLFFGADPWSLRLLAFVLASKLLSIYALHRALPSGQRPGWSLLLLPLSEWFSFVCWLSGFRRHGQVLWRGEKYSIAPNGNLIPA